MQTCYLAHTATGSGLLHFVVHLGIIAILFSLAWWVLSKVPLPPPIKTVVEVVLIVVAVIVLINILLALIGHGFLW